MASTGLLMTRAGLALQAANLGRGQTSQITAIEVGSGHWTPVAGGDYAALNTPFNPRRQTRNPGGVTSGPTMQAEYFDGSGDSYTVREIGLWAGPVLIAVAAVTEPDEALATKIASQPLRLQAVMVASATELSTFRYAVTPLVTIATETIPGILRIAADGDTTSTDAAITPAQLTAALAAFTGSESLIYVPEAQVSVGPNNIALTPAGAGAPNKGDMYAFFARATSSGNVALRIGSAGTYRPVYRRGVRLAAGGLVNKAFYVIAYNNDPSLQWDVVVGGFGSAAYVDTGTGTGHIPVLGTGGKLDPDRLPIYITTGTSRPAGAGDGDLWATREA